MSKITFLGNFGVSFSSENHHKLSLEALGHEVIPLQEGQTASEVIYMHARNSDMFVWVHTHGWETPGEPMDKILDKLKAKGVPTVTYHLDLWFGLQRQKDLDTDKFYKHIGYFFTVDKQMADWFNANTQVKGHWLPPGVYHKECYIHPKKRAEQFEVIFVGSRGYHPEWSYRPKLVDWLAHTYGDRFKHFGGDGLGVVRGDKLNYLYANTKVVVGDSTNIGFDYPNYWSDRVPETLGRGGFLIHPYVPGIGEFYEDGKHLVFYNYNDFEQLKGLIDYYLVNHSDRERIRQQGHAHVKANHTYKHRWQYILEVVNG